MPGCKIMTLESFLLPKKHLFCKKRDIFSELNQLKFFLITPFVSPFIRFGIKKCLSVKLYSLEVKLYFFIITDIKTVMAILAFGQLGIMEPNI